MLTQPMRMIPLGFVDKFAPAKLCIEPDQVQVKLSCKGLDYLRLHTTLNDVVMSFMMAMMMMTVMVMMVTMVMLTIVLSSQAGLPSLMKGTKWPMAATVKFSFRRGFEHDSNTVLSFFGASFRENQPPTMTDFK